MVLVFAFSLLQLFMVATVVIWLVTGDLGFIGLGGFA